MFETGASNLGLKSYLKLVDADVGYLAEACERTGVFFGTCFGPDWGGLSDAAFWFEFELPKLPIRGSLVSYKDKDR